VNDFEEYFTDSEFLNEIQRQANIWICEVQKVTRLERDVPIYSVIEEINHWKRMEESLNYLEKELKRTDIGM
jgi:dynein heavy chain 1, cytosolic